MDLALYMGAMLVSYVNEGAHLFVYATGARRLHPCIDLFLGVDEIFCV